MKEVLLSDQKDTILKCFKDSKMVVYLWQDETVTPKRVIYPSRAQKLDVKNESVTFETHDYKNFDLYPGKIYCFNEDLKYFFKLEQVQMQSNTLIVKVPDAIKVLSEQECNSMSDALYQIFTQNQGEKDYTSTKNKDHMVYNGPRENIELGATTVKGSVGFKDRSIEDQKMFEEIVGSQSLSEEDKKFANKRNAPRAKPKDGKIVKIHTATGIGEFDLYDLSTGGMSIITTRVEDFSEQSEISIEGFDDKSFEQPMKAIVRGVRDIKDLLGQYKIGLQFMDE